MLVLSSGQITVEVKKRTEQPVDLDAVLYAIRKAGIEPVGRAGQTRLFSESAVEAVCRFLARKRPRNSNKSQRTELVGA